MNRNQMKKKLLFAVVLALVLTACNNEETWNGEINISAASSEQLQVTRAAAATNINGAAFASGEQVDVWIYDYTAKTAVTNASNSTITMPIVYTAGTTTSGSTTMTYESGKQPYYPSTGNNVNIYGIYPHSAASSFTVKADQSTDANYKASDLMYGVLTNQSRTSTAKKIQFSHQLSKVVVSLTTGTGAPAVANAAVTLKSVYSYPYTIAHNANKDGATFTQGTKPSSATDIKVMTTTTNGTATSGAAIIPPQTIAQNADFITISLASGGTITYKLAAQTTFEAGKVYTYNVTINLQGITVTTAITDWASGSTVSPSLTI